MAEKGLQAERSAEWGRHIEAWRASGQSKAAWCRTRGLNLRQFQYWIQRLKGVCSDGALSKPVPESAQWLPVAVTGSEVEVPEPKAAIVVRLGRAEIEVRSGVDIELFSAVVKALMSAC